ncbi:hypothetical protein [Trinickia fusca]|uniref:Uncharacterized protein n=1 Tax=Trinickia fusca TaxID=2419777 RepID=A0A494X7S3_9BURK|nr:hypothetical protein [Trinickia fusca]RKP46510.1 hypothetical protein D7S89_18005 [Trinickia fusca]
MSYVLEKIDGEARKRVDADVGPDLARIMDKRHFWESGGGELFENYWAIDRESGNYLMLSPRFFLRLPGSLYFFFFRSRMYRFRVQGSFDAMVDFYAGEKPPREEYEEFKQELTKAFAVHGEFGVSNLGYVPLVPAFPAEV